MTVKRRREFVRTCGSRCTLNPINLPPGVGELIHTWYEDGTSQITIGEQALEKWGIKLSGGALGRHAKSHLQEVIPIDEGGERLEDLEVLDTIIQRGAQQVKVKGSRVTTDQLLKAMELRLKLTQGSVFDHMFEAMKGAPTDLDVDVDADASDDSAPDMGADEQAQAATTDAD